MNRVRKSFLLYFLMMGLVAINLVLIQDYPYSTYIIYIFIILVVLRINEGIFWGTNFKKGLGMGAVLISTVFLAEVIAGWVVIEGFNIDRKPILFYLVFQTLVAFSEEISFRGYILKNFIKVMGFRSAIILNSIMFSALHIPSFGFYSIDASRVLMAFIVIALISIIMSIIYLKFGLLSAVGFHLSWNFLQYHIFTLSSIQDGILKISYTRPDILTGGNYGPEAGIAGFSIVIIALFVLILNPKKIILSK